MIVSKDFAREVEALALTVTGYQIGKSGQQGLCDCIGLIMGAMSRLGHGSYPMHSTNYFARFEMRNLRELSEPLQIGQIVYKAREDASQLNDRYRSGGRYYTGDLLDYYHVGVVTDVNPLEITHCTQTGSINGIKRDSTVKGWTHVGELNGVEYAAASSGEETMSKTAYVTASNGKPVRLRKRPDTSAETITKIPVGTVVTVNEQAESWSQITADGKTGYMMSEFLNVLEYADEDAGIPSDVGQNQPSGNEYEQEVLQRLERIETLLNAILSGEVGVG